MNSFWDDRYRQHEFVYSQRPVKFLEAILPDIPTGKILLPGEGEGRNGVYAATLGWEVQAFDFSKEARKKAMLLAGQRDVEINYTISDYQSYEPISDTFDLIGLFYTHMDSGSRQDFHKRMVYTLKPGGKVVMQAFSKKQLGLDSGGPKHLNMYFDLEDLKKDFEELKIEFLAELEVDLDEGKFHQGLGHVIQLVASKNG